MAARKTTAKKKAPVKKAASSARKRGGKRAARKKTKAVKGGSSAKRAADAIAQEAKDQGATGGRLPSAKTQLRDSMIVARVAQGLSYAVVAEEAKVTKRTVERVVAAARLRSPLEEQPMRLLEELAVGLRLAIGDFEAMALAWFDSNQSAALGAKKASVEARAQLATLMADVGKLPSNLELFRTETALRRVAEEMLKTMRAVAAGEMDVSEAIDRFREMLPEADVDGRALPVGGE